MRKKEIIFLVILLVLAGFFRLWNLNLTQFITYDQARDFIIIKRILVDHKFTLVGPTVLIPGVYLPPFYYYLLVPFMLIFQFQPLGADVFTAILGIGAVFLFYLLAKEIFGKIPAYLGSLLFAVSPIVISFSRHAWNPNASHFFSLAIIYCLYKFLKIKKWFWFYGACAIFSLSLNFHFSMLAMMPIIILVFLYSKSRKPRIYPWMNASSPKANQRNSFCCEAVLEDTTALAVVLHNLRKNKVSPFKLIISLFSLLVFISPLFFFEIRHHFSITTNIFSFLFGSGEGSASIFSRLNMFFNDIFRTPWFLFNGHLLNGVEAINPSSIILMDQLPLFKINSSWREIFYQSWSVLLIFLMFVGVLISINTKKEKKGLYIIISWFLFGVGLRFLLPSKSFYFYQYNFIFPAVFLLLVNLFSLLDKKKRGLFVILILFSPMFILNIQNFSKLPQSLRSESYFLPVVEVIAKDFKSNRNDSYVVAANNKDSQRWDHNGLEYRYFLEAYYKMPISNWELIDYQQAKVLYLIDEGDSKEPLKLGGMEMKAFAPQKIEETWFVENGQKIYKMSK